jgi:hypothetical protein
MTPEQRTKGKSGRRKKAGLRWIVGWTIEEADEPGFLSVSLLLTGEPDDSPCASTTRYYLMHRERVADLVNGLASMLQPSSGGHGFDNAVLSAGQPDDPGPASAAVSEESDESDFLSSHFALGAYGLVGN